MIHLKQSKDKFYFIVKAGNGETLVRSTDMYNSQKDTERDIADYIQDGWRYSEYVFDKDAKGKWFYKSAYVYSESFESKDMAQKGLKALLAVISQPMVQYINKVK